MSVYILPNNKHKEENTPDNTLNGLQRCWIRQASLYSFCCRSLRFRWYQGFVAEDQYAPEWAIDNVFIGMACMDYCLGHGACSDTMMCTCDQNRVGDSCVTSSQLPTYLSDDFEREDRQSAVKGQLHQGKPLIRKIINIEMFHRF